MRSKERLMISKMPMIVINIMGHVHRIMKAYGPEEESRYMDMLVSKANTVKQHFIKEYACEIGDYKDRISEVSKKLTVDMKDLDSSKKPLSEFREKQEERRRRIENEIKTLEDAIANCEERLSIQKECVDVALKEIEATYLAGFSFKRR